MGDFLKEISNTQYRMSNDEVLFHYSMFSIHYLTFKFFKVSPTGEDLDAAGSPAILFPPVLFQRGNN
jgi:hypothetical protein